MKEYRFNALFAPLARLVSSSQKREPVSELEAPRIENKRLKTLHAKGSWDYGGKGKGGKGKSSKGKGKGEKSKHGWENRNGGGKRGGIPASLVGITPFGGRKYRYGYSDAGCSSRNCTRGEHKCMRCGGDRPASSPIWPAR